MSRPPARAVGFFLDCTVPSIALDERTNTFLPCAAAAKIRKSYGSSSLVFSQSQTGSGSDLSGLSLRIRQTEQSALARMLLHKQGMKKTRFGSAKAGWEAMNSLTA